MRISRDDVDMLVVIAFGAAVTLVSIFVWWC
jgi:hypothetical protein